MDILRFDDMMTHLAAHSRRLHAVVVWAADPTTRQAVAQMISKGVISATFVGSRERVEADPELKSLAQWVDVADADTPDHAAALAVELIHRGKGDIIVKGLINTDNLLRALLDKQCGILPPGKVLTHISMGEIPAYHKLLMFSDAAVIPYPTPKQREAQVDYTLALARKMGIKCPKVVMVHSSEKADARHFPFIDSYLDIKARAAAGDFGECVIDGPLDVKTALDKASLEKKGIDSAVGGDADILIFPDIVSANVFYKTLTLFGGATLAGVLCGAMVPVVLPSRGDTLPTKALSILLAAAMCGGGE